MKSATPIQSRTANRLISKTTSDSDEWPDVLVVSPRFLPSERDGQGPRGRRVEALAAMPDLSPALPPSSAPVHRPLPPMAIIVGVAAIIAIAASIGDYVQMVSEGWSSREFGNDYQYYYVSGWMVLHGDLRCYQRPVIEPLSLYLTDGLRSCFGLYQVPPCVLLSQPLALTDYFTSTVVFLACNHVLLLASVWLVLSATGRRPTLGLTLGLWGLTLLFPPAGETLLRGQINIVALFFLSLFLYAVSRRPTLARDALTAVAIAIVGVVKVIPSMAFLPVLLTRRYRLMALAAILAAAAVLIPMVVAPDLVHGYIAAMDYNRDFLIRGYRLAFNQSWPAVCDRFFVVNGGTPGGRPLLFESPPASTAVSLSLCAVTWVLALAAVWKRRGRDDRVVDVAAMVIAALGAAIPYNFVHHHTWLLIPLLVLWMRAPLDRVRWSTVALLLVSLTLWTLDGFCLMGWYPVRLMRYYFILWGGGAFAAAALFGLAWGNVWRDETPVQPRPGTP